MKTERKFTGRPPSSVLGQWLWDEGISSKQLAERLTKRAAKTAGFKGVTISKAAVDAWRSLYRYPGTIARILLTRTLKITESELDSLLMEKTDNDNHEEG